MIRIYSMRGNAVQVEVYDKFFGTPEQMERPHPVYETSPSVTIVAELSDFNGHVIGLHAGAKGHVVPTRLADEVFKFMSFLMEPHWKNTIETQVDRYGSLFDSDND